MPTSIEAQVVGSFELPGEAVFPESIGVDAVTGDGYVGSLADGTLYRLTRGGQVEVWSAGGHGGRGSVAGVKVDIRGRLWAAGGSDGTLWVYDLASRGLLARLTIGTEASLVNDIAFGIRGEAYATDSLLPVILRADGDQLTLERWVDLTAAGVPWPPGLNLNCGLLVVNGQLDKMGGRPRLPFTVVAVAVPDTW